jgi:hypothetical protein
MSRTIAVCAAVASAVAMTFFGVPSADASTINVGASTTVGSSWGRSCDMSVSGQVSDGGLGGDLLPTGVNLTYEVSLDCDVANVSYLKLVETDVDAIVTDHTTGLVQYSGVGGACQEFNWINCSANGSLSKTVPGPVDYEIFGHFLVWGKDTSEVWTSYPDASSYTNRIGCFPRSTDPSDLTCYFELRGTVS